MKPTLVAGETATFLPKHSHALLPPCPLCSSELLRSPKVLKQARLKNFLKSHFNKHTQFLPQQCLYFLSLLHGHFSFLPIFGFLSAFGLGSPRPMPNSRIMENAVCSSILDGSEMLRARLFSFSILSGPSWSGLTPRLLSTGIISLMFGIPLIYEHRKGLRSVLLRTSWSGAHLAQRTVAVAKFHVFAVVVPMVVSWTVVLVSWVVTRPTAV